MINECSEPIQKRSKKQVTIRGKGDPIVQDI